MKLTKQKLIKNVQGAMVELGYIGFKDTLTGASGLFIKQVKDTFYLTLGLEISNYYDSRFSASYYLSKTTRWGSVWGDIPIESYERIGYFLTKKERTIYLNNRYNEEGVNDAWWNGFEEREIKKFLEVVDITEERFLKQEGLLSAIENSSDVKELVDYVSSVIKIIDSGKGNITDYRFVPPKPIDDIPIEWFEASEEVILTNGGILNANTVKLLAADAWRQNLIKKYMLKVLDKSH